MVKLFSILMLFLFLINSQFFLIKKSNQNAQCENKLIWLADRKLKWADFQGRKKDFSNFEVASSRCGIHSEFIKKDENYLPIFSIYSYFLKDQSWTISWQDDTLEHEQIHFDIFELYARKTRKSFDSLHNENERDFEIYQEIFQKEFKRCIEYNDLYDREVYTVIQDSGVVYRQEVQDLWKIRIQKELIIMGEFVYIPD